MTLAQAERAALVETLRGTGPDAPTLCDGWTTRDLLAHLIVRERRLDAAPGIMVKPLSGYTERVRAGVAERDFDALLTQLASGPPIYSPFFLIDRVANLAEMFVHHEDVLRGAVQADSEWTPRTLSPELEKGLVTPVKSVGKMTLRSSPATVVLRTPDGTELTSGGHGPRVTVTGPVGELLLFAFGRAPVTVAFDGDAEAVASVRSAPRGF
ncbi:TIGR03085 family metal-binding protein [Gordonia sp. DT30]|uniref:TIGR03085 family metal-binding protein n=1 Tax=Gordonia sp. DT30 TaxID=3416546 RepID=UPI003CEB3AA4